MGYMGLEEIYTCITLCADLYHISLGISVNFAKCMVVCSPVLTCTSRVLFVFSPTILLIVIIPIIDLIHLGLKAVLLYLILCTVYDGL